MDKDDHISIWPQVGEADEHANAKVLHDFTALVIPVIATESLRPEEEATAEACENERPEDQAPQDDHPARGTETKQRCSSTGSAVPAFIAETPQEIALCQAADALDSAVDTLEASGRYKVHMPPAPPSALSSPTVPAETRADGVTANTAAQASIVQQSGSKACNMIVLPQGSGTEVKVPPPPTLQESEAVEHATLLEAMSPASCAASLETMRPWDAAMCLVKLSTEHQGYTILALKPPKRGLIVAQMHTNSQLNALREMSHFEQATIIMEMLPQYAAPLLVKVPMMARISILGAMGPQACTLILAAFSREDRVTCLTMFEEYQRQACLALMMPEQKVELFNMMTGEHSRAASPQNTQWLTGPSEVEARPKLCSRAASILGWNTQLEFRLKHPAERLDECIANPDWATTQVLRETIDGGAQRNGGMSPMAWLQAGDWRVKPMLRRQSPAHEWQVRRRLHPQAGMPGLQGRHMRSHPSSRPETTWRKIATRAGPAKRCVKGQHSEDLDTQERLLKAWNIVSTPEPQIKWQPGPKPRLPRAHSRFPSLGARHGAVTIPPGGVHATPQKQPRIMKRHCHMH